MPSRVSVVIPSRDRRTQLLRCLAPVLADPGSHQVIVVLDGSTDGSGQALSDLYGGDPRLQVLESPGLGQEAAQFLGASRADGDLILFLDDDVELLQGGVSGHGRHHEQGDVDVVVGYMPCELRGLGPDQWPVWLYSEQYERKVALWGEDPGAVLRHLWGGNVSIRRDAWWSLPPYPGEPLRYHVDWELGLRCQWAGLRSRFAPELRGIHRQQRDVAGFLHDRRRSAQDRIEVHQVYGDRLGPLSPQHFCQDASAWTRWVILSGVLRAARLLRAGWAAQLRVATTLGARRWERRCALDLTSLEGAIALAAGASPGSIAT